MSLAGLEAAGLERREADLDPRLALGSVKARALVISSEQDLAAPPWQERDHRARISGSRLVVIRGASHLAHYETPGPVTDAVGWHMAG